MSRHTISTFVSPGLHLATAVLSDLSPPVGAQKEFEVRISHFLTLESQDSTHYFFTFARDFAVENPAVTEFIAESALKAFHEDVEALQAITVVERREASLPFREINIKSDQAGIAARQILKRLADSEADDASN